MKKIYFLLFCNIFSYSQTQIGIDINGEDLGDNSGRSVSFSADGSVVAIGAHFNLGSGSGNGATSGHVRVFQNISGAWTQVGADINGEADGDLSGLSVSLSSNGNIVAIGAPYNAGNGATSGHVRLYQNISGVWTQVGTDINGESAGDYSGYCVSLSSNGSVVAIGAPYNAGNGIQSGHVRVFQNISGVWTQVGVDINGEFAYNYSGESISLSSDGSIVAIGAVAYSGTGENLGHVRVFKNISGIWTQVGSNIIGEANNDFSGFGVSLSSDGNVVAIGATSNDGNGLDSGHVRVYKNLSGVWTQVGVDINGEAAGDSSGFGVSLSSDGNVVAIGALYNNGNGIESGHVRVFQNISEVWTQVGVDINGEAAGDNSGYSISLSSNGNILAIGAPYNDGNGVDSGHVRIYDLSAFLNTDGFVLQNFTLYPNPTSDFVNISLRESLNFEKVNIYNTLGQLIKTEKNIKISVVDLAKGNYCFEVFTNKGKATKTISVK